jgi:hypothetical protein
MKHLLSSLLVLLLIPTPAVFSQCGVLYDGIDTIASNQRKVRDVTEVNPTPLFDNAPFLHLRKGDKLVKARRDFGDYRGKPVSKPVSDPDRIDYYLLSGGNYYLIETEEENGKLLLSPVVGAFNCLLFDWEMTMENAKALRELLPKEEYAHSLTIEQYDAIVASVGKEFPEIEFRHRWELKLCEGRLVSIPGHHLVEFQGLAYDRFENRLYNYTLRIGPEVCSITEEVLAQGPKHVERYEFEGEEGGGISGPAPWKPDAKTAKIKKAEYDKMMKFQNLVMDAINSKARSRLNLPPRHP